MKPVDPQAEDFALANEIIESLPIDSQNQSKKPKGNTSTTTGKATSFKGTLNKQEKGKHPQKTHAQKTHTQKSRPERVQAEKGNANMPRLEQTSNTERTPRPYDSIKLAEKPRGPEKNKNKNKNSDKLRKKAQPVAEGKTKATIGTPGDTASVPTPQTTASTMADATNPVAHQSVHPLQPVAPLQPVVAHLENAPIETAQIESAQIAPPTFPQQSIAAMTNPTQSMNSQVHEVMQDFQDSIATLETSTSVIEKFSDDSSSDGTEEFEATEDLIHAESAVANENTFAHLGLQHEIVRALETAGYVTPTDIQAATIPALLEGRDVLGQAQTGTGKTAAFALPLLSRINVEIPETQVLVLAPTRELAIQVSESFLKYGQHLRGLRVAPIYGGSGYTDQIHALRRGAHVVVGTPGRVMDHMRESRLRIDTLSALVLDEADEMLRMGFVDDVQWILDQSPENRQIALFSATMPEPIRQIANKHLKNPKVVTIASKQRTGDNIEQRFLVVDPKLKLEALTRVIEAEEFDGMIIFVKTKIGTVEVADYLRDHGYQAVALNGDIAQAQRERTIEQLKEGVFNILVATDVAARGLDVQRITHVINFDLPPDAEAYVHRIGRTGRAGRRGQAIVFVAPKQRGFLREIDRAAGDSIEPMAIPSAKEINASRVDRFKERMKQAASKGAENPELFSIFEKLISQCVTEQGLDPLKVATGLAVLAQGERAFYVHELPERLLQGRNGRDDRNRDFSRRDNDRGPRSDYRSEHPSRSSFGGGDRGEANESSRSETFRVEVGRVHGVKPGNIVGAIANEIGLDPNDIGQIRIEHDYSTVDLPSGMPRELFKTLGRAWVLGRQLRISKLKDHPNFRESASDRGFRPRKPGGFSRGDSRGDSSGGPRHNRTTRRK